MYHRCARLLVFFSARHRRRVSICSAPSSCQNVTPPMTSQVCELKMPSERSWPASAGSSVSCSDSLRILHRLQAAVLSLYDSRRSVGHASPQNRVGWARWGPNHELCHPSSLHGICGQSRMSMLQRRSVLASRRILPELAHWSGHW